MGADRESSIPSPLGMAILEVVGWHLEKEREIPEVTARPTGPTETDGCRQRSWKDIKGEELWVEKLRTGNCPQALKGSESLSSQDRKQAGQHTRDWCG